VSKKKSDLPRFAANISSEEDDYNFMDEGDDEIGEKTIATHLKNNAGHRTQLES